MLNIMRKHARNWLMKLILGIIIVVFVFYFGSMGGKQRAERIAIILAAEDVGLADPQALVIATACQQAVHFVGMPEGFLPLAECAIYLATAPKSNSALTGYEKARADARVAAASLERALGR